MTDHASFHDYGLFLMDALYSSFSVHGRVLREEQKPMNIEEAFLADIIKHPQDDTPRLIFADFLDDNGDSERAEFIRVQCELARAPFCSGLRQSGHPRPCRNCKPFEDLRRRERELLDECGFDWFGQFVRAAGVEGGRGPERNAWHFRTLGGALGWCLFQRGFIHRVECKLEVWLGTECSWCEGKADWPSRHAKCPKCHGTGRVHAHGPAIVKAAPLERVTLADREPSQYTNVGDYGDSWYWCAVHGDTLHLRDRIPGVLAQWLTGHFRERDEVYQFRSRQLALDTLSRACLAWARAQPLPTPA